MTARRRTLHRFNIDVSVQPNGSLYFELAESQDEIMEWTEHPVFGGEWNEWSSTKPEDRTAALDLDARIVQMLLASIERLNDPGKNLQVDLLPV